MSLKEKAIFGGVIVLVTLVCLTAIYKIFNFAPADALSAVGGQLIEQYDPYVRYNGGLNTNLPIKSQNSIVSTGTFQLGSSGTVSSGHNSGTCLLNLGNTPASFSATSTINADCQGANMLATAATAQSALTGVTTNDVITLMAPTTTPSTFLGIKVQGCNASSTPGYITCRLTNETGAAYTPGTTTVAGWQYGAWR